jgi:glycosyltransferase involved in cell wall biosynthesis
MLDCRWLHIGGPGRTTELLLRGLAEGVAPQDWVLWGPPATAELAWPGTTLVPIAADPRLALGQRHARSMPRARLTVFMHQQRPLRNVPAVTLVYDTIALRYGNASVVRTAKRLFMRRVAAHSRRIVTISEHSRASVIRDLGVPPERVHVVRFPFDPAFVDRVAAHRSSAAIEPVALYVGGFLPHKNLPRLVAAFGTTRFCRDGGRLVLVGGSPAQAEDLWGRSSPAERRFLTVVPSCDQAELDRLFATSLFLVQPSLEEGFGLPAWEAMCSGLPVCASDGGSLPEVVGAFVRPFPATDVAAMAGAIDDCADTARSDPQAAAMVSDELRRSSPTIAEFGRQFHDIVEGDVP